MMYNASDRLEEYIGIHCVKFEGVCYVHWFYISCMFDCNDAVCNMPRRNLFLNNKLRVS